MSDTTLTPDWDTINKRLREPFDPAFISFRPQGKANAQGKTEILAYVDARDVQDRLDEAVGAGNWSFDWEPLRYTDKGNILLVKANLTIHGVMKSDVGEASTFSPSKGAVSDALKRAAAQWGIARYLYDLPKVYGAVDQYGHIAPALLAQLRDKLPKPGNIKGRAQFDEGEDASEHETASATDASTNGNATKRQPAHPKPVAPKAQPEPDPDIAALHDTLKKRLDDSDGLKDVYLEARTYGLKGERFFKELLRVADLPSGALGRPLASVPIKQMAEYVAKLAADAKTIAARTPDLSTVATPEMRP